MHIRPAIASDLETIARIHPANWQGNYREIPGEISSRNGGNGPG